MIIEARWTSNRDNCFSNLFAEALLLYYIILASAIPKADRRKAVRA